jgi:hypothetical protein
VVIHLLVPVNPAIVASMTPPIVLLATATGHNPALYGLPVIFSASCAFLLPLDAVTLIIRQGLLSHVRPIPARRDHQRRVVVLLTALLLLLGPWLGLM